MFVRGASRILADESCDACNSGQHDLCLFILELERLRRGTSHHRDYISLSVTRKTCLCYRSNQKGHLDGWPGDPNFD